MPGATAPPMNSQLDLLGDGHAVVGDERRAVFADGGHVVDDPVRPHLARVVHTQVVPRLQSRAHHQRLYAEIARAHVLHGIIEGGHDGGNDRSVDGVFGNAANGEHVGENGAVFVTGAFKFGGAAEGEFEFVPFKQPVFDVRVSDVDA